MNFPLKRSGPSFSHLPDGHVKDEKGSTEDRDWTKPEDATHALDEEKQDPASAKLKMQNFLIVVTDEWRNFYNLQPVRPDWRSLKVRFNKFAPKVAPKRLLPFGKCRYRSINVKTAVEII